MPKINQEEYEVLKNLDDNKWKWIARNYNGALITYTDKPMKNPNLYWDSFGERIDDRLFQFIQWEDEEPYNIQELIEEYEYSTEHVSHVVNERVKALGKTWSESEEKEVKENIEWLKEEIEEDIKSWGGGNPDYFRGASDAYENVKDWLNQLDEPEVLSQEWIDKNKFEVNGWNEAVHVEDLQNLLVPKQEDMFNGEKPDEGEVYFAVGLGGAVEINSASSIDEAVERLTEHDTNYSVSKKPVIPKFVSEAIEKDKEDGYDVYDSIDLIIETNGGGLPSISNWVARNIDKYARAWLDGYTVEEEQKYIVSDNSDVPLLIKTDKGKVMSYDSQIAYNNSNGTIELTEQEIKDYDERYWTFAVKVEELE